MLVGPRATQQSHSLRHDERTVWAHIKPIMEHFEAQSDQEIETTQYQNRASCLLLSTSPFTLGLKKMTWNFSERSHGNMSMEVEISTHPKICSI